MFIVSQLNSLSVASRGFKSPPRCGLLELHVRYKCRISRCSAVTVHAGGRTLTLLLDIVDHGNDRVVVQQLLLSGIILSLESNPNVESKTRECGVQNSIFSGTLQLHCKFRYWHMMFSVVCRRLRRL